jgi:hypothetical protein|tara:strand:+ start:335 stop:526 length:192 start_codon:yes stop_codon:yes gene_type:complete
MDSEVQKIENMIEVMCRLKELEKELRRDYNAHGEIFSLILALIATAEIPNITLLPNIEDMARA